ncbi:methylmalonate-semialdehyde dehydrogenase (CoA acylating) [Enterococcus faecalis]|jgi:malonate-semialdehyde dehydrogenase (acetylating)/methylmalonate-semialdehyde dehydrogenase|uniref:CoA-acylating methylmalonate-semialdehyde dehydrogenase n=1 Tax=Enterococcus faecalis TaxID=1351 RepID=UPI000CF24C06|nr:CoA-acylating methylmalonate-semialdehyde dehydrogenase [Enterococcus faecalis]EGO9464536.1 methylmalonate-semialdehyde dehydrogenase (CoA acylating) [Enterococcus faecalis]EIT2192331.1 CoA-acylating methylmalonate-semialdehyde dehydrogenase [Enterococcus faecalis]EIY5963885.1 CoA-acylating methylmalonate-semialdehyde dehydrogenase [Enterococcus faecalis]EKZ0174485.1 CoA-acylating methylmalonate-semialdehyde dehydrogenase [Enterococcus faecalis]MBP4070413.1 CoA-acylating methylmalonate-semi
MTRFLKNYIGGRWVTSTATEFEEVVNPATEEALVNVPLSSEAETAEAIRVADEAFQTWKKVSVPVRGRYLFKLHHLLMTNKEELARLITLENGKSLSESLGEVQRGIENVEHAAGITNLIMGDSLSTAATDIEITNYRYPIGVVGGITPFNFPMMVPFWIFPMALAAGNTVVLKPSEKTPLLMEKIVELIEEAGFPSGVFNVVYGAHDVVNTLLRDPLVKGISFVGSKNVGEYVYKEGTKNLKRVQALTGAKNHVIVLKDANLDRAVKDIIGGSFGSAGERCMAASVIVVEETIADQFVEKFKAAAQTIKIGNGLEEGVFLGPVIRKEAQQRTFDYIQKGIDEGADLLLDGRENIPEKGYFVGPTIFDRVTMDMKIWQDEIFAPVASIVRVKNLEAAVTLTNQSEFANGSCLYTSNASAIRYFRENVDAGMLGINLGVPAPMAWFAFSGWKHSFYGDLHANGKDSVEFYTHRKVVTARYAPSEIN